MTILIDMDDTLEHLLTPWLRWLNREYGKNVEPSDVVSWNMQESYPDLTKEEIFAPLDGEAFWDTVTPVEGAPEAVEDLIRRGHRVFIVTAASFKSVAAKMERVLFRYFPYLSWDQVIITSNKQMIRADVMVDDGYHNLENGDYVRILVDAPYNRKFDERKDGMIRVYNWEEIDQVIRKLETGMTPEEILLKRDEKER